jgi:GNAT superfamily N-acetyltransferase
MHRPSSAIPADLTLAIEPYAGEGPRWVVAQAEAELVLRYGFLDQGELGLTAAMFDPPAGAFVVGRAGAAGPAVGGVGVRALDPGRGPGFGAGFGVGEIRRLWVAPDRRGLGVARRLMDAIEQAARDLGLTTLRLVTGERQPEAVALYDSTGWQRARVDGALCGFRFTKELVAPP